MKGKDGCPATMVTILFGSRGGAGLAAPGPGA